MRTEESQVRETILVDKAEGALSDMVAAMLIALFGKHGNWDQTLEVKSLMR